MEQTKKHTTRKIEYPDSLPVENVQALASKKLKDIPAQYIRPELKSDNVSVNGSLDIPVIDLRRLLNNQSTRDELIKFHSACKNWGFFQLVNHGVAEDLIEKMKVDTKEFFKLPLDEKQAYSQLPSSFEGYGQTFVVSEDQKLDWGDMLFLVAQPKHRRTTRLWPNHPTSFKETLDKYSSELQRLTVCLLGFMAKNLEIEPKKLTSMFASGSVAIRMNYYPPCCLDADKVLGLSPHSDSTGLTLLIQVNQVQGLQIRKNGSWIPVKPFPGAFIVNIGDMLEILTNGEYKSIEHRAVVDPVKERVSVAAFHSPMLKDIGPIKELVSKNGGEEKYKTMDYKDYLKLIFSSKLDGKNLLESMKLLKCNM